MFTNNQIHSVFIISDVHTVYQYLLFLYAEVQNMSSNHLPSSNTVGVPFGVDVNAAHAHVLLSALLGVDVVITKNNTPSPGTVDMQKKNIYLVWQFVLCTYPRISVEYLNF